MTKPPYDIHLILNTHWDREWRWSFRETQLRLQEAMDTLLDLMDRDPRFAVFHADAQAAMIDDYLDVRPEHTARVQQLVSGGRLLVGPWYTLPAQFLVSGEALVRNLLLGHRLARGLGGVSKVAYNIFSWGQVSQLPQIYRQFGMETILFYRGIDQSALDTLEFWWEAPDGSRALALTFGAQHRINFWVKVYRPYLFGKGFPGFDRSGTRGCLVHFGDTYQPEINHWVVGQDSERDLGAARAGLEALVGTVKDKSSTPHLAFFQGFDLENPDPVVPDLVEALNADFADGQIRISSLPDYVRRVRTSLESSGAADTLPVLRREMLDVERVSPEFGALYPGVFSARMPIKQANRAAEIRLVHWAEPACAWASLLGAEYPATLMDAAWKLLLQCQQHDGIGGTHTDRVALATLERYREASDIADMLTRRALRGIVAGIDVSHLSPEQVAVVVFNPTHQEPSAVVEATIDFPEAPPDPVYGGKYRRDTSVSMVDAEGRAVACQVLSLHDQTVKAYRRFGSHAAFEARRMRVAFDARALPPAGYATFTASQVKSAQRLVESLVRRPQGLENDHVRVDIRHDGTLALYAKRLDRTFEGLHVFEDVGDRGGPLMFAAPWEDRVLTTAGVPAEVSLLRSGPLVSTFRIARAWEVPARLGTALRQQLPQGGWWNEHGPVRRSDERATLKITTDVTLRRDSALVEFETTIENTANDHRLRVMFPTGLAADVHVADAPFDVVSRPVAVPAGDGWFEDPLRTFPSQSFVDISDGRHGLAVFHLGLPEYEVTEDAGRTVGLTLLRCFGIAGGGAETWNAHPLAQLPGTHTFRYALWPHEGDWRTGGVAEAAERWSVPVRIAQTTPHHGSLPLRTSLLHLEPASLRVSGVKRAEDGDGFVCRCYNPTPERVEARLVAAAALTSAEAVTLEEVPVGPLSVDDARAVRFRVKPGEIVSVRLRVQTAGGATEGA